MWYSGNKLELRHHPLIGFYKYDAILFLIIPFDFHSHLILSWQELNSAHQSFARLHSGFFGIPHMFSVVRLLGSRSLPWLIRALLDHITNKVRDAFENLVYVYLLTLNVMKRWILIRFEWFYLKLYGWTLRLSLIFHDVFQVTTLEPMITGLQAALPKSFGLVPFDGGVTGTWWCHDSDSVFLFFFLHALLDVLKKGWKNLYMIY